ncbi:lipocalin-like domain-containing protein [Streptomyces sp. ADI98-10]|uniref:lipocalin-like domain-containing protein n=1 Tax=Streptomyces sp. ADI98-10 TaxID=1522763 RepID=UPI0004CBC4BE|nr:lipocalin-like domain-containing protein [Streptomyces sp. ADI98-10]
MPEEGAAELAGVWSLVSFDTVGEDGSVLPGPLGENPTGLLFYSADGHVGVHMMPADGPPAYLSYAGTWRREADRIVHRLTVAGERDWLGTDQSRQLRLDGDRLTLTGTSLSTTDRRVLVWRRLGRTGP